MLRYREGARRVPCTMFVLLAAVGGCRPDEPRLPDSAPAPRLLLGHLPRRPIGVTESLELRFSAPVDPETIGPSTVWIVPHTVGDPCTVDLGCSDGVCHRGFCRGDPVDGAWIGDAARPPLIERRLARTAPLSRTLSDDGLALTMQPTVPLQSHQRYTLGVSAAVAGLFGVPLQLGAEPEQSDPRSEQAAALRRFVTAGALSGRPTVALLSPTAGTTDLPTNLARVVVAFSRPVRGVTRRTLGLVDAGGRRVPGQVDGASDLCGDQHAARSCYVLRLFGGVEPLTALELRASEEIVDDDGRPLLAGPPLRLATGPHADHDAPVASAVAVDVADRCFVARLATDEPVDLRLSTSWGPQRTVTERRRHEVAVPVMAPLDGRASLKLADLAGNVTEVALPTVRAKPLPAVVITEVRANPAGPEPAQELVELRNLSGQPVSLGGWRLDDGDDGVGVNELPTVTVSPNQYVVVVGERFSVDDARDPAPRSEAVLVRIAGSIGERGLANSGERLVLRDAAGRLVSTYGGHHPPDGAQYAGTSVERIDQAGCDVGDNWRRHPMGASSPGWSAADSGRP